MRYVLIFFLGCSLLSCQQQNDLHSNLLHKQAQLVNYGMKELLNERLSILARAAAENPNIAKPYYRDARFYYDNTYFLIYGDSKQPDSLIIWRLTETKQANKYGFTPQLDSSLVFGNDSIMRTSALLLNLYNYVNEISRSISICWMDYGLYPEWEHNANSPTIKLYGDPTSSFINGIVSGANVYNYITDTMPLLGTLILTDTIDTTLRPLGK